MTVPNILAEIVAHKQGELVGREGELPGLEKRAEVSTAHRRPFRAALASSEPAIIAEMKNASPSKGVLSHSFHPEALARSYRSGGAAALSVLTDARFFQGSFKDLQSAREAVRLPVLRKDFTLQPFDVIEAAAHGADAILLIAAIFSVAELRRLRELASSYAMDSLIEVHDEAELDRALESGGDLIGVNNRDLHTFQVHLETSLRLAGRIPQSALAVSESGIHSGADIRILRQAGYRAFLVGEHLMTAADPASALEALRQ